MDFFSTMFRFNPPKRDFNQIDILKGKGIYEYIDWKNTVVGGSYALKQFTGDSEWESSDVDIFTSACSFQEFKTRIDQFCSKSGANVEKVNDFTDPNNVALPGDEKFHELVKASATLKVPGIDKKIQFIYLHDIVNCVSCDDEIKRPKRCKIRHPTSILNETSDLPSCVSYSINDVNGKQEKMFYIPEKGRQALFYKRVDKSDACPSRVEKYQKRGYTFYD